MKRYLPFIIIAVVAGLTVGIAMMLLRANRRALAGQATNVTSVAHDEIEPNHSLGPSNAPVTLEEFADFQCPACAGTSETIHLIAKEYDDRLRVVFWEFPLKMHEHAREAALAAEAASQQGRFWEMHDLLYRNQTSWRNLTVVTQEFEKFAQELDLDLERFRQDAVSASLTARIEAQRELGEARGVKNTPTLFIDGQEFPPPFSAQRLRERIDATLAAKKTPERPR